MFQIVDDIVTNILGVVIGAYITWFAMKYQLNRDIEKEERLLQNKLEFYIKEQRIILQELETIDLTYIENTKS